MLYVTSPRMGPHGSSSESSSVTCGGGGPVALGMLGVSHARESDDAEAGVEGNTPQTLNVGIPVSLEAMQPFFRYFF